MCDSTGFNKEIKKIAARGRGIKDLADCPLTMQFFVRAPSKPKMNEMRLKRFRD